MDAQRGTPGPIRKACKAAFPYTIPIFAGFWFLGLAYGVYMHAAGFRFLYPLFMSVTIFGGSLEFIAVSMLTAPFAPAQTFAVALLVQARHLFYGLSMLDRYKNLGWKRFYLIYGLCDETFSINYTVNIPPDVDKGWFFFFVTLFNQAYWVSGATIGGLVGSLMKFNTEGLDFVMTAMFVVIFMEQWKKDSQHKTALIGFAASGICLAAFGPDSFLLPSMGCILAALTLFRGPIARAGGMSV